MNTDDLGFTQGQLEQFAQENNDIYFAMLEQIDVCIKPDLYYDLEESFWW